jgi:glycosyltransferase involved in cell wall biosynthesis
MGGLQIDNYDYCIQIYFYYILKVLFPFVGDSVGGSHRSILELYQSLKKIDIIPIFVLHNIGPLSQLLDNRNIKYEYLPVKYLAGESPSLLKITFGIVFNFLKLRKFIRENGIDIVHGNDLRINLTWSLTTRLSGVFYIWHQRSLMSSSILWKISALLASHFVTISQYVHQSLPSGISKFKKTLVLNPFNVKNTYERKTSRSWLNGLYNTPKDSILFGYVGRLIYWKNIDFLIRSFVEYTSKRSTPLHLIIVGTGDNEYVDNLKELVNQMGAKNIITFSGFNYEPNRVISALDFMIASSNFEPFGRTLVEAMIQGTPVLAARGGGHSEIINDGFTGRLYTHNDMKDFIRQCDIYIDDDKSRYEIINKANIVANSKYSVHLHAESIVKIYQKLLAG